MHRLEVTFRPEAIADLQDIYRIVFRISGSRATAARFVQRIIARSRGPDHRRRARANPSPCCPAR